MPLVNHGLTKLMEECGELIQIAAKKEAFLNTDVHPDNKGLMSVRLIEEMADVVAAISLVMQKLGLDREEFNKRYLEKIKILESFASEADELE